jgi:succinyl-CoA reductase
MDPVLNAKTYKAITHYHNMRNDIPIYEPATGNIITYVPNMSRDQVRSVIGETSESAGELQSISANERAKLLVKVAQAIRSRKEELAKLLTREIGRPIKSTRLIIERTASIYELAAQEIPHVFTGEFIPLDVYGYPPGNEERVAITRREPIGLVAAITPFNFPPDSMAHKVAPALAVGNPVVLKPSLHAPLTEIEIVKIIKDSGFPLNAINVVTGDAKMIGDEFIEDPNVALISFTGSSSVGLDLAGKAISRGKKVIMELGGSDAIIVLEDADIDKAVQSATIGRFDYAGQFCNATKRLIVRREVYDEFMRKLVNKVNRLRVGDPMDESVDIGPLISIDAVRNMESFIDDAVKRGGKIVFKYRSIPGNGFYYPPTILEAPLDSRVLHEEVFGPILPVVSVDNDEDAIRIANSTEYGLDASIFTRNFSKAYRMAARIKAGTILINDTTRLRFDNLPFGGFKKSGIGRESVRDTMIEMTEVKVIVYSIERGLEEKR